MADASARVDAYIEKSADFAKPILKRLRRVFLKASPKVQETIKWGCPHFEYNGIICGIAAFKKHVSFGFWRAKEMSDPHKLFSHARQSMCAVRVASLADLPSDRILTSYVKQAVALNEASAKRTTGQKKASAAATTKELRVPDDLAIALKKSKKARETFDSFSWSNRRDYVEWLTEAKQQATRKRRLATALEWLAEGKPRNWKYMKEWR